jgi:hypothetical protein
MIPVDATPWKKWIGIVLIGLSGVWFGGLLLAPFTPFPIEIKAGLALFFAVLMEVSFWLGTVIVGKQVLSRWWKTLKSGRISQPDRGNMIEDNEKRRG